MRKDKKAFQLEIVNETDIEREMEGLLDLEEAENGNFRRRIPLR